MNSNKHWWNREVTWGVFIKLIIILDVLWLALCWRVAYVGDLIDKERAEYYNYLEERVKLQEELLDLYRKE